MFVMPRWRHRVRPICNARHVCSRSPTVAGIRDCNIYGSNACALANGWGTQPRKSPATGRSVGGTRVTPGFPSNGGPLWSVRGRFRSLRLRGLSSRVRTRDVEAIPHPAAARLWRRGARPSGAAVFGLPVFADRGSATVRRVRAQIVGRVQHRRPIRRGKRIA